MREDPDLAIVVVHNDDAHALGLIGQAVQTASGPVIAQLHAGDVDFVAKAAELGISAYIESSDPRACRRRSRSRSAATARRRGWTRRSASWRPRSSGAR